MKRLGTRACAVMLFALTAALALASWPVLVADDGPHAAGELPEMAAARWSATPVGGGDTSVGHGP